jgi:hypothetical protein
MYSKELDLNSYINCLWNYYQAYNKSIKKKITGQENKWLKILERSKLNLNQNLISKLLRDPNNIFKIVKFVDMDINQIQVLKLRYFIGLYWLNYLIISSNKVKNTKIFSFNNLLLNNWSESIDKLISIFESRSEIMISERDKIYNNLTELEKIRLKCPKLDKVHQQRLESQLKALRYILNIDIIDDLRNLSSKIRKLNSENFVMVNNILDGIDVLKSNFSEFMELFDHISNELLLKHYDIDLKIFEVSKSNYSKLVRSNLSFQMELEKYKEVIYNTDSLTWRILDDIKIIELDINLKNTKISKFLISKTDKMCHLIYKIILQYNSVIFTKYSINDYLKLQKDILEAKDNLRKLKDDNYNIINDLEKQFNYSDLKDLDLEFYYQFLIHINSLIYALTKGKEVNINSKKYLSNENLIDRKNFDILIRNMETNFVTKREFHHKINQIEHRMEKVEENKSNYVLGTMVISLISLFIWKKIINFKKTY